MEKFFVLCAQYRNHSIIDQINTVEDMKDNGLVPFHGTEHEAHRECDSMAAEELDTYGIPYSTSRCHTLVCTDCEHQQEEDGECEECGGEMQFADYLEDVASMYIDMWFKEITEQEYLELKQ